MFAKTRVADKRQSIGMSFSGMNCIMVIFDKESYSNNLSVKQIKARHVIMLALSGLGVGRWLWSS